MFFRVVLISIILFFGTTLNGQITESFDSWVDGSYGGVSTATLGSGDWETNNSLAGSSNPRTGAKCIRFNDDSGNNEYLEYKGTDGNGKDNGLGTISFWYRHWDGDGSTVQFQVQYNQSGGGWTNIGGVVNVTSTTYTQFVATPNILGNDILIRVISITDDERMCLDDFEMYDYTVPCSPTSQPTTISNSLSFPNTNCSEIELNWTSGNGSDRIVVVSTSPISGTPIDQTNYPANSIYGAGSTIAAGEYVIYNGTGNSVTVSGLNASTTYFFAIFEYNGTSPNCDENYLTSSSLTGNETTIACSGAEITGILVDACGGSEGIDEFFTFTNGTSSLSINDLVAHFPAGGSFCNSGCGGQTWVTNATYVAQLNTTAGCPGLFVETDPIPANADVIVFTGANPSYNFDFSGLCGTGPYYAVFANNANTSGRFGNYNADCTQYRTLSVEFGGGDSDTVTYQRCALSNTDGDFVDYDAAGNATYKNEGCTPTSILPIELLSFTGKNTGNKNILYWTTAAEVNNDYFTIEKSIDAENFVEIGTVLGAGNSNYSIDYQFIDNDIKNQTNYYRLKQTDFNGQFSYSNIISLNGKSEVTLLYNSNTSLLFINGEYNNFSVFDIQGKLIKSGSNTNKIQLNLNKGIYVVKLSTDNSFFSKKIVVH